MGRIAVEGLTKVFPNGLKALDNLNLEIEDGEFFALLGPSGCGKTTLLRVLAGLEVPTAGRVWIGERDVTHLEPGKRNVAMVFQDYALYPHMDVADNIAYPLKVRRVPKAERRRRAAEAGSHLGLDETMMGRRPGQLSGGQQQRVALARAIAFDPVVFLFDEPLSNLDARLRMEARTFLKRLHAEVRTTTVYVTHDQSEALALADRMAVMERGVIRQMGPPSEVFHRPANLFVAQFIGSTPMNLLSGRIDHEGLWLGGHLVGAEGSGVLLPGRQGEVIVGIRPEHMTLRPPSDPSAIPAQVEVVEDLGTTALVTTDGPAGSLQVVVPEEAAPKSKEAVGVWADWTRALFYDPGSGELLAGPAAVERRGVPAAGSGQVG